MSSTRAAFDRSTRRSTHRHPAPDVGEPRRARRALAQLGNLQVVRAQQPRALARVGGGGQQVADVRVFQRLGRDEDGVQLLLVRQRAALHGALGRRHQPSLVQRARRRARSAAQQKTAQRRRQHGGGAHQNGVVRASGDAQINTSFRGNDVGAQRTVETETERGSQTLRTSDLERGGLRRTRNCVCKTCRRSGAARGGAANFVELFLNFSRRAD